MPEAEAVSPVDGADDVVDDDLDAHDGGGEGSADPADAAPRRVTKFMLRRDATRAALLELGRLRFRIKGYSGTTIDDIVRDSGYTRGAFYFHFASREEFFIAVLMSRAGQRGAWWETVERTRFATLDEAIRASLVAIVTAEDEYQNGFWVLPIVDFMQTVRDQPELLAGAAAYYERGLGEITRFVTTVQHQGLARTDLDPRVLAQQMYAIAEGYSVHMTLWGMSTQHLADTFARLLRP